MKSKTKKTGFSIIELLTVMSIIMILLGILVPSLSAVRRYARVVRQKGMFHDISKGLEMFSVDHDGYPNSSAGDPDGKHYCGAMKLCEAMVGQDGLGFHPDSVFKYDGKNAAGDDYLYYGKNKILPSPPPYPAKDEQNLRARKKYSEGKNVQIGSIETLFSLVGGSAAYDANNVLLCDVFKRNELRDIRGEKAGMPILYYRADTSKLNHDYNPVSLGAKYGGALNIYNYWDNYEFIKIKPPSAPTANHPLFQMTDKIDGQVFYENTIDKSVTAMEKSHNPDSYILISAGWDGLYGTEDDVFNFED